MSRQNDWKVKQFNKGNCIWCGKPREVPGFKRTCRACGKKHRARLRVKRGSSAWRKPGDMGRPPLWAAVSKTPPRPVVTDVNGPLKRLIGEPVRWSCGTPTPAAPGSVDEALQNIYVKHIKEDLKSKQLDLFFER